MVRTAVKTLTLNVYGIPLPAVQRFVTSRPASAYFVELATFVAEQCQVGASAGACPAGRVWQGIERGRWAALTGDAGRSGVFRGVHARLACLSAALLP